MRKSIPLSDVTMFISRGISPKYTEKEILSVINQKCIRDGKINYDLCRWHNNEVKRISEEKKLQNKDILVNSTGVGTLGRIAQIDMDVTHLTCDSHVTIVRPDSSKIDPNYLGAFMFLNQDRIEELGHGSTGQTELSKHILGNVEVPQLCPSEQYFVGNLFRNLSQEIDLNLSLIGTLESMVRVIFTSWFVNFDPVLSHQQKSSGNIPAEIRKIFPNQFADSRIGKIPEGWEVVPLNQVFEVKPHYKLKKGTPAYFVDMKCLNTSSLLVSDGYMRDFSSGSKFKKYDSLFARITPCLENGKTGLITTPSSDNVCWGSTEFIVLSPKSYQSPLFPYCWARDETLRAAALASMTGSSGRQRVANDFFENYLVAKPPLFVEEVFKLKVAPMLQGIELTTQRIKTLTEIRDTLLPKLISGELRIPDAEKFLEEAGI